MAKINLVHESNRNEPCQIIQYLHCGQCLKEKPADQSPETWAHLTVGTTRLGVQIWCVRHKCSVDHIKFTTEPVAGIKLSNDCGHDE